MGSSLPIGSQPAVLTNMVVTVLAALKHSAQDTNQTPLNPSIISRAHTSTYICSQTFAYFFFALCPAGVKLPGVSSVTHTPKQWIVGCCSISFSYMHFHAETQKIPSRVLFLCTELGRGKDTSFLRAGKEVLVLRLHSVHPESPKSSSFGVTPAPPAPHSPCPPP